MMCDTKLSEPNEDINSVPKENIGRHQKFFDLAQKLSMKSAYYQQLGAVIVQKSKILGVGFNKPNKTHVKSNTPYKTIHAELDAILSASFNNLTGATIYVYRQHRNGALAMSKPCKYCLHMLAAYGIRTIYYTTEGGYCKESL